MVRLHMSRERTTLVELTSRIGRLVNCPIGMTRKPDAEFAKRFCPSGDAMILEEIASGKRKPSCGVRLDERSTCSNVVCAGVVPGGMIMPVVGFWGLLGLRGLIGACVLNVA